MRADDLCFASIPNLRGRLAATVPAGWTDAGLAIAVQVVGPWLGCVRAAAALLQARTTWMRRPEPLP